MLQNAYLLSKIGADTAENERNFAENLPKIGNYPTGPLAKLESYAAEVYDVTEFLPDHPGGYEVMAAVAPF